MTAMSSNRPPAFALSPRAEQDLEEIWRYTAENWSLKQADSYVKDLFGTFRLLASMPEMARERTEFQPPVRIHLHQSHLVVYLATASGIDVVRILGGRQDWHAILNEIDQ